MDAATAWAEAMKFANRPNPYPYFEELRKTPVAKVSEHTYVVTGYPEALALAQQLLPVLDQIQADGLFRLRRGRMVLEIRPAIDHTKAHAVQLLERSAAARLRVSSSPSNL